MRVSVTGATGFLGSAVSRRLTATGHHVISWVREPDKLTGQDARYFDLSFPQYINLKDTDVLIHCAAYLPKSYEDPTEAIKCLSDNGVATLELLQKAEEAGVQKFIYISSGTIYNPLTWMAREDDPIYPSMRATYYLTSKMVGDIFADHCRQSFNTRIITMRPSSIYGPGMKPRGLVPRLTQKIMKGEPLLDEDVGNYEVDLVYIDDVAYMATRPLVDSAMSGIFNVGGGQVVTTLQVAKTLAVILGKEVPTNQPPKANGHAILDISRALNNGYKPRSLEDGLRNYVESLQ